MSLQSFCYFTHVVLLQYMRVASHGVVRGGSPYVQMNFNAILESDTSLDDGGYILWANTFAQFWVQLLFFVYTGLYLLDTDLERILDIWHQFSRVQILDQWWLTLVLVLNLAWIYLKRLIFRRYLFYQSLRGSFRKPDKTWARSDTEKENTFVEHLVQVFTPHGPAFQLRWWTESIS